MIKKHTVFINNSLRRQIKQGIYRNSQSFDLALIFPTLVIGYMCKLQLVQDYVGPEAFKKHFCVGWTQSENLRIAFDHAVRMETILEPWTAGCIKVTVNFFREGEKKSRDSIDILACPDGYDGCVGSSYRSRIV